MLKPKKLWLLFSAAAQLTSCSTLIPNIEPCSPTGGVAGVAALCQNTNNDGHRRMDLNHFSDFLFAQPERPDPDHPGQTLPAKGPAVCLSSIHWSENETAIAQLCIRGKCTYEDQQSVARALRFRGRVLRDSVRKMGGDPEGLVAANDALLRKVLAAPAINSNQGRGAAGTN